MKYSHFRNLKTENIKEAKVILGSASYDLGCSCGGGTKDAPKLLRELSSYLPEYDANFHDLSNVLIYDYCDVELKNNKEDFFIELEQKAKEILTYDKFMLFFGGDHSISVPLEKAFYEKYFALGYEPVIIHIDAHMDILDEYMGSKMSHACPNRRALENGYKVNDIHMIAIRSYEQGEVDFYQGNPSLDVTTADMYRKIKAKELVNKIKNSHSNKAVYYVSFDIDAVDPGFAPGTGTPESFGLTPLEIRELFEEIFTKLNVLAMDIVEISPKLDVNNITSWLGLKLLYEIFYYKFGRGIK